MATYTLETLDLRYVKKHWTGLSTKLLQNVPIRMLEPCKIKAASEIVTLVHFLGKRRKKEKGKENVIWRFPFSAVWFSGGEKEKKTSAEFIVLLACVFTHHNNEKEKYFKTSFCFLFSPFLSRLTPHNIWISYRNREHQSRDENSTDKTIYDTKGKKKGLKEKHVWLLRKRKKRNLKNFSLSAVCFSEGKSWVEQLFSFFSHKPQNNQF